MKNETQTKLFSRLNKIRPIRINKLTLNCIFIFALILLIAVNLFSYNKLKHLLHANRWVLHTYEVIGAIDAGLYSFSDMESDQRAFLVTNDPNFLKEADASKNILKENLVQLHTLTKAHIEQAERVSRFIKLIENRLLLMTQVVDLKGNNNLDTIEGFKLFDRSNDLSNQVKGLGQEIKSVEFVLLQERNRTLIAEATNTSNLIIIGSTFSIIFLIIPFLMANFELINRKIIESKIRNTHSYLRQIIESTNDMIATLDTKDRFQIFNEAYQRLFKRLFDKKLTKEMNLEEAFSDIPEEKQPLLQIWKDSLEPNNRINILKIEENNIQYIYELNSYIIKNERDELKGIVHTVHDVTTRLQEHDKLQDSYQKLEEGIKELQAKNAQITLLVDMSDIMLAASSLKELSNIMSQFAAHLLNFSSGYLYIMHPSKNYLERTSQWGTPTSQESIFTPEQCWGLRLGRTHYMHSQENRLICDHVKLDEHFNNSRICVPLMAQNDIYGLLLLEFTNEELISEDKKLIITAFSELTALAFANMRLRENLRYQSIRDPLTGLYNRRFLEDALFKELRQAERDGFTFAILMLDLDHFKKINDSYGHDAGDSALREVGEILSNSIGVGDLASRYGGEEFIVLLHNINKENAKMRAEEIRQLVSKIQIQYGAQPIGPFSVSIGISIYPQDSKEPEHLIECADNALYWAKNNGRNQVIIFGDTISIKTKE